MLLTPTNGYLRRRVGKAYEDESSFLLGYPSYRVEPCTDRSATYRALAKDTTGNPIMSAKISSVPDASGSDARLLLENLQDPQFLESLRVLVEKSQALIDVLDRGERTLSSISNRIAELGRAGASALSNGLESFDVDDLKAAGETLKGIIPVVRDFVSELGLIRQAGFFDPEVVKVIGGVGHAMSAAARDPDAHSDEARSIFEFTLLLKDPEVARTLNFAISLARHFGSYLDKNETGSVR